MKTYTVERASVGVVGGRYSSNSGPASAAKKAASRRMSGAGKVDITVRELGSQRTFSYVVTRTKLAEPLVVDGRTFRFKVGVKAVKRSSGKVKRSSKVKAGGGQIPEGKEYKAFYVTGHGVLALDPKKTKTPGYAVKKVPDRCHILMSADTGNPTLGVPTYFYWNKQKTSWLVENGLYDPSTTKFAVDNKYMNERKFVIRHPRDSYHDLDIDLDRGGGTDHVMGIGVFDIQKMPRESYSLRVAKNTGRPQEPDSESEYRSMEGRLSDIMETLSRKYSDHEILIIATMCQSLTPKVTDRGELQKVLESRADALRGNNEFEIRDNYDAYSHFLLHADCTKKSTEELSPQGIEVMYYGKGDLLRLTQGLALKTYRDTYVKKEDVTNDTFTLKNGYFDTNNCKVGLYNADKIGAYGIPEVLQYLEAKKRAQWFKSPIHCYSSFTRGVRESDELMNSYKIETGAKDWNLSERKTEFTLSDVFKAIKAYVAKNNLTGKRIRLLVVKRAMDDEAFDAWEQKQNQTSQT